MNNERIRLNENNVQKIFLNCVFKEQEIINGKPIYDYVVGDGIFGKYLFNRERLNDYEDEVLSLLCQIPKISIGLSFSDLCMIRNINVEQLFALARACNYLEYLFPRASWPTLPGGVPFIIQKQKEKRLTK